MADSPSGAPASPSFPRSPLMMQSDRLTSLSSRSMPTGWVSSPLPAETHPTEGHRHDGTARHDRPLRGPDDCHLRTIGRFEGYLALQRQLSGVDARPDEHRVAGSGSVEGWLDGLVVTLWRPRLADSDGADPVRQINSPSSRRSGRAGPGAKRGRCSFGAMRSSLIPTAAIGPLPS